MAPTRPRIDENRVLGAMVSGMLQKQPQGLEAIGFRVQADGTFAYPTQLRARDAGAEPPSLIVDMCSYELELETDGETRVVPLAFKQVEVGMRTFQDRLQGELATPPMQPGAAVRVACRALPKPVNAMSSKAPKPVDVFAGEFTVPEERHPLGHPEGAPGYMVQVTDDSFMFVYESGKVTYQGHL